MNKIVHSTVVEMVCETTQRGVLVPAFQRKLIPSSVSFALKMEVLLISETLGRT